MTPYQAIMKAANHIERNPGCYDFSSGSHPDRGGGTGCALAWIGYYLGTKNTYSIDGLFASSVCQQLTGDDQLRTFFNACTVGISNGSKAPSLLRAYAEKYHSPSEAPKGFAPWLTTLMEKVNGAPIPAEA